MKLVLLTILCGLVTAFAPPHADADVDFDLEADRVQISSCLDASLKEKYGWTPFANFTANKRDLILEVAWWDSAILTSQVFYFIASDVLGYKVNFRVYDAGPSTGARLKSSESADVALEIWQSDSSAWYQQYVQLENTVVSYGSVGYSGRVGLYFPTYMFDQYPQFDSLNFWKALAHPEKQRLFPRSGTAPLGLNKDGQPICDGDPTGCVNATYTPAWYSESEKGNFMEIWLSSMQTTVYYFQRLIDGLHINATIAFLGDGSYTAMLDAYNNAKPFVAYNWRPTTTVASLNLTRIVFPDDPMGEFRVFQADPQHNPIKVDIPVETLFKASSSRFGKDFPELVYLISKFSISDKDIEDMLKKVPSTVGNWTDPVYFNSSCDWILKNEDTWKNWVPPPPKTYDTCPIGMGRYFSNNLWMCLSCPAGTYNFNASTTHACEPCIEGAICSGGKTVNADHMYWMSPFPEFITGDYIPELHLCPHPKQCCPHGNCTMEEACEHGFAGILCTDCADPNKYAWNGQCMNCQTAGSSLYLSIIAPFFVVGAVLFVPKYHAAEIEQIFFYYQVINLIFEENLGEVIKWEGMDTLLALFSLNIDRLVINCPLPIKGLPKALYRFLIPFLILIYFFWFYGFLKMFPFIHKSLPKYLSDQHLDVLFARSFTIIISFVLMPLTEAALVLMNCATVDGHKVVYHIPTVECYSDAHKAPLAIAYFTLAVLLLFYPLGLLVLLFKLWREGRIFEANSDHSKISHMDEIYESFYQPYRPLYFFMESVMIWERGLIVLVFTFMNHNKDSESSLAYLAIFAAYGLTRAYIQPFNKLLQVYLNREIGIGFLLFLALRQYAKYEPSPLNISGFVITIMLLPVVNHALRWIRQGYLERHQVIRASIQRVASKRVNQPKNKDVLYSAVPNNILGHSTGVTIQSVRTSTQDTGVIVSTNQIK
ncbi:hypothetical protein BDR26DRAFT_853604 [Obelidium mucronatum]|nr:hypothetical protein BDR26DRAFT_853604 [Obelidium mucronatum]